jgi:hypothetical protein
MSGDEIRHTPFASWKDPDAWMETMKGPKWRALLKEEASRVDSYIHTTPIQSRLGSFVAMLESANDRVEDIPFSCGPADVAWNSQFDKTWQFRNSPIQHTARDLDTDGTCICATKDAGKGAESFVLEMWPSASAKSPSWSQYPVGPDIAIQDGYVYYLGVKNKLIYHQLWRCDVKTGKEKELLYTEKIPTINLSLEKHADGTLFLVRDDSQDKEYFEIKGIKLRKANPFDFPKSWRMPKGEYGLSFVWERLGLCITKQHGSKMLWKVGSSIEPKSLLKIPAGHIQLDPYAVWLGKDKCIVRVTNPAENPAYYKIQQTNLELIHPMVPTGLTSRQISAKSADGTTVYGILIYKQHTRASCLLGIGYGAYGLETGVPSALRHWSPLLENEWAVLYTFPRGGGDHTDAWGKAGRREGRQNTVDDFIALVRTSQHIFHIPPTKTAIYGRSAGGLLMGMTLAQNPGGSLMSAVYTEVPYVDVLRTTTNPTLPLTQLEYNEFGDPMHRLEDFISVGLQSPVDSATVTASPSVFVLTRTAENDSEVFAYESVKWIRRLRSHDTRTSAPKLCIVETGQGHFTPPDKQTYQRGLDCAFLDAWCKGNLHNLR